MVGKTAEEKKLIEELSFWLGLKYDFNTLRTYPMAEKILENVLQTGWKSAEDK